MSFKKTLLIIPALLLNVYAYAGKAPRTATINNSKIKITLNFDKQAIISSMTVNGEKVISGSNSIFTSVKIGDSTYSSLHLNANPVLTKAGNLYTVSGIIYGDKKNPVTEKWIFTVSNKNIKWVIQRNTLKSALVQETATPVFTFDSINTWEGAYQGYGGVAWFYLFNQKLNTYGVHTRSSDFWNSKTGNGLNINVNAPGKQVAMKYTRTADDKLAYTISVSGKEMGYRLDSGTYRRRFLPNNAGVWAPFNEKAGTTTQTITLSYFSFDDKYGRGKLVGINGNQVGAVLNTIARIGVIDSLHYGGNSWHTPYGPICLHEQYIAQMGLGINDPKYLNGYKSCLDYYRDHAFLPDGRVYPRWAYTDEDMMPGKGNKEGFYEAQWGYLLDSNPDYVTNVSDLYNLTGDKHWVAGQQKACEKALDWIINRDSNNNGFVEMMNDNMGQQKSSDWIDIIWASYENAFVNAKLYHALMEWTDIENQLHHTQKAKAYAGFAAKLKSSFNKSIKDGGFWDDENKCYVHWREKDGSAHGRNMVTPVNFMAIAYGICDDDARKKTILDGIETQMQKENLFFWPLCMYSYAPGEGRKSQYPFPEYENGDIFLSWGSIAVKAYAEYDPALAVKYVKNVLEQYSKDGLAYQRYGRQKQDGRGDDILSGNSLSITGLYQAIYGINPLYNRLYLDPHITPELAGTELKYRFRGKTLFVQLDNDRYSITDKKFKINDKQRFGFNTTQNGLSYFHQNNALTSLQLNSKAPVSLDIASWNVHKREWLQTVSKLYAQPLNYIVYQLKPNTYYSLAVNDRPTQKIKTNANGDLIISRRAVSVSEKLTVTD